MNTLTAANLSEYRARRGNGVVRRKENKGRKEATVLKHVAILEKLAKENGGLVPTMKWLNEHGYFHSYNIMLCHPTYFAHLPRASDANSCCAQMRAKKAGAAPLPEVDEIRQAIIPAVKQQVMPPAKYRSLAQYNIQGALFSPTELKIDEGVSEGEWLALGRVISTVAESAKWWVGDFLNYGFRTYGKAVTYNLAEQATGWSRGALYGCAYLARKFEPVRRVESLSFHHHVSVVGFKPELADKLLGEAAELGLTSRQIQKAGCKESGKKNDKLDNVQVYVSLMESDYKALQERAGGPKANMSWYIGNVVVPEWLRGKKGTSTYTKQRNGKRIKAGKDE